MNPFSLKNSSPPARRSGSTLASLSLLALVSLLVLTGAGSVPIENFKPSGAMQADLNAGNHSITNAATVSASNFSDNASGLTNFTLPTNLTTQGNTFNGTNQLVQTDTNGLIPFDAHLINLNNQTFFFSGDSITSGSSVTPFGQIFSTMDFARNHGTYRIDAGGGWTITSLASGGSTQNLTDRYVAYVKPYRPTATGGSGGSRSYLFVLIGVNDINLYSLSSSAIITALSSYVQTAQADGFTVIVGTILPRTWTFNGWNSANEKTRQAVNAAIRAQGLSTTLYRVADYETIFQDPTSTTLFQLGLHPTAAGNYLMAQYLNAFMTAGHFAPVQNPNPVLNQNTFVFPQTIAPSQGGTALTLSNTNQVFSGGGGQVSLLMSGQAQAPSYGVGDYHSYAVNSGGTNYITYREFVANDLSGTNYAWQVQDNTPTGGNTPILSVDQSKDVIVYDRIKASGTKRGHPVIIDLDGTSSQGEAVMSFQNGNGMNFQDTPSIYLSSVNNSQCSYVGYGSSLYLGTVFTNNPVYIGVNSGTTCTINGSGLAVTGTLGQSSVTSAMLKANGSGVLVAATAGTDYAAPYTFSTGLTNASGTVTVNYGTTSGTAIQGSLYGAASGVATLTTGSLLTTSQIPAFTGDVTNTAGSLATKVVALNKTNLAGLATGLLKNTTGTGVPFIAVAGTNYLAPPAPQRATPTTGGTVTITASSSADLINLLTPAGTLATLTISMPTGGYDGQLCHIVSSQIITAVTFSGATTSAAVTGISTAKTGINFTWDATATTWRQD